MKRELVLSLATLVGMASAGACAQSSATVFGVVDATLTYGKGSIATRTRLANSGNLASRFGVRGSEDLGGGTAASFWFEAAVNNDDGTGLGANANNQPSTAAAPAAGTQGLVFNRRSTVSLSGGWGELRLGRDYVPQAWNLVVFDPFLGLGGGLSQMFAGIITGPTALRASNSIGYFAPGNLGGFYGQAVYYLGENASNAGATEDDGKGAGLRFGYAAGPVDVAIGLGRTKYAAGDVRQNNFGGTYNLGIAKVMGMVSRDRNGATKANGGLIGMQIPIDAGEIRASYSEYRVTALTATTAARTRKLALGYVHNLSKRTAVYATYARLDNNGGATQALNAASTAANASSTGYDLGIRHSF